MKVGLEEKVRRCIYIVNYQFYIEYVGYTELLFKSKCKL